MAEIIKIKEKRDERKKSLIKINLKRLHRSSELRKIEHGELSRLSMEFRWNDIEL